MYIRPDAVCTGARWQALVAYTGSPHERSVCVCIWVCTYVCVCVLCVLFVSEASERSRFKRPLLAFPQALLDVAGMYVATC